MSQYTKRLRREARRLHEAVAKGKLRAEQLSHDLRQEREIGDSREREFLAMQAKIRRICLHSWALPVDQERKINPSFSRLAAPMRPMVSLSEMRDACPNFEHMNLNHLIMWCEQHPERFQRYVHFAIDRLEGRPNHRFAYCVTDDVLALMKESDRSAFACDIAMMIGKGIHDGLNKKSHD